MKTLRFLCLASALAMCLGAHAQYARDKVRFLSQIPLNQFSGAPSSGSGCAGYISPSGNEYAIMGLRNGNAVVNITNPTSPVIVGHIPGVNSQWHEVCVLGDYAYATTEGGGGIQIIDLRQADQGIVTLAATYTGGGVSTGHTIQAIPESKLIMIHGGNMSGNVRGVRALDCTNPENPVEVGTWTTKYVHDALYVKRTFGPDAGKMICYAFCANGNDGGMYIIDVTTTKNAQGHNVPKMETLGFIRYYTGNSDLGKFYSHSGALSPDGKVIFANDELDEMNGISSDASTHIINVENLRAPTYGGRFINPINAIDHNSMTQDGFLFLSAYKSGLRIYDMANSPTLKESGFFDSYPGGSGFQFNGAWGTWAGFPSGNVIISDIDRGLFVVDPSEAKGLGAPITASQFVGTRQPANPLHVLRKQDDVWVKLIPGLSKELYTETTFTTDSLSKSKIDITVVARNPSRSSIELQVLAKNHQNGLFESVGVIPLTNAFSPITLANLDGTKYVSATNQVIVRVQIKAKGMVSSASKSYLAELDMVKLVAHN